MRSRVSFGFSVKFVRIFGVFEFLMLNGPKPGKRFDAAEPFVSVLDLNFFGIYATRCFKLTIIIPFLRPLSRLVQFSTAPSLTVLKLKLLRLWPKISFYVRGQLIEKWKDRIFDQLNLLFPFDRFIDTTIPIIVSFPEYCFLLGSLEA